MGAVYTLNVNQQSSSEQQPLIDFYNMNSLQTVEFEVWNKESWASDGIEDMYLGSCQLTYD